MSGFFTKLNKYYYYILFALFLLISVFNQIYHEPWIDEAQAWLIAKDTDNVFEMFRLAGYEGSPMLWHLLLRGLIFFYLPYRAMSGLSVVIICSAIVLLLKYSPFSKLQRTLLTFGYFFLYEYNTIARSYGLTVLFIFAIACLYEKRFLYSKIYSLLLILMMSANIQGLIIAVTISSLLLYEMFIEKRSAMKHSLITLTLLVVGFSLTLVQLWPPKDLSHYLSAWTEYSVSYYSLSDIVATSLSIVGFAFIPFPELRLSFWNTSILSSNTLTIVGIIILYIIILCFFRHKKLIYLFSIPAIGISFVSVFKYHEYLRHFGFIFIMFIFCLWIGQISYGLKLRELSLRLLLTVLIIQLLSANIPMYYEHYYRFSAGEEVAQFLEQNDFLNKDTLITALNSFENSISAIPYVYKKYPKFYKVEYNTFKSYYERDLLFEYFPELPVQKVLDSIDREIKDKDYKNIIFISTFDIKNDKHFIKIHNFGPKLDNLKPLFIYRVFMENLSADLS